MCSRPIAAALCLAGLGAGAAAKSPDSFPWPPIGPEVWALDENGAPGEAGAMILSRSLRLADHLLVNDYRIRICSERGKSAAEFPAFSVYARNVQGRVVYRDGKVVRFDSARDFHTKTWLVTRMGEYQESVLVPPGITSDCLVDLHWEVPQAWRAWSAGGGHTDSWDLASRFPVGTLKVALEKPASFGYSFLPGGHNTVEKGEEGGYATFTIRNIPPVLAASYALAPRRDIPRLKAFVMDSTLRGEASKGIDSYWNQISKRYQALFMEDLETGSAYRALSGDLRRDLPDGPQARALELAQRLQDRILNRDSLSLEEWSRESRKAARETLKAKDLEGMIQRGSAHTGALALLLVRLLLDAGLKPQLLVAGDRNTGSFNPGNWAIDFFDRYLIAVDEPGKQRLLLDPGLRFAPPTLILPWYQGTQCLGIDLAHGTHAFPEIPVQPAGTNCRHDSYRLELHPDRDQVSLETVLGGYDELLFRRSLLERDAKSQNRWLKGTFERQDGVLVDHAEVTNLLDKRRPLTLQVSASIDRPVGRLRQVDPFPLTPLALEIPGDLDERRVEDIVLPYLRERRAESRFRVPPGYRWAGMKPFRESNPFGSVAMEAELVQGAEGPEVFATLVVTVDKPFAGPGTWNQFKTFLGWLEEAGQLPLTLERLP
jgi:hypothetical protein